VSKKTRLDQYLRAILEKKAKNKEAKTAGKKYKASTLVVKAMDVTARFYNRIELTKFTKFATKPYLAKELIARTCSVDEDEINNVLITNTKMKFWLTQSL